MERFIAGEFAGPCDTDDGEHLFDVALPLLVARHVAYGREEDMLSTKDWARTWTPKVADAHPHEWFVAAEQRILAAFDNHDGKPSLPSGDAVSRALGITTAKRESYALKHLPAIERPPEVRKRERKAKKQAHDRAKRQEAGAKPRKASISARKPWEAHGISRATYYRRVEAGMLPADPGMRPVLAIVDEDDRVIMRLVG